MTITLNDAQAETVTDALELTWMAVSFIQAKVREYAEKDGEWEQIQELPDLVNAALTAIGKPTQNIPPG
jgi:hypothetical protein